MDASTKLSSDALLVGGYWTVTIGLNTAPGGAGLLVVCRLICLRLGGDISGAVSSILPWSPLDLTEILSVGTQTVLRLVTGPMNEEKIDKEKLVEKVKRMRHLEFI
uniref:Uncharacterized protein n=1 Tax=Haemonchus contortus TaxID=6289 RepID=W6NMZ4_HAECO